MRNYIIIIIFLNITFLSAQPNTEVYLFDIIKTKSAIALNNLRNISNNDGYDNQPSFYNDTLILFSSTRNKQTDIAAYNILNKKVNWICNTKIGSEYSPIKIPNQEAISAIRLDTTGKQLLYRYDYATGTSEVLLEELAIGYHSWHTNKILISSVIQDEGLSLVVSNLITKKNTTIQKKTGRSLHKIPNTKLVSYISKTNTEWEIRSLNPTTGETKKITKTIPNAEDMCWLIDGTILMSKENVLYAYNPKTDTGWNVFHTFKNNEIKNISRIQTNKAGTLLALVSEITKEKPEQIVQRQVDAYNARNIDAFMDTYSDDIEIYNFPDVLSISGKYKMREKFKDMFNSVPNLYCEIKNRITLGNKVVDREHVRFGENYSDVIAIYEITDGKISKVTFLR